MQSNIIPTVYKIETERVVIRCYKPQDIPLLTSSIQESLSHLKPWMPWAHFEPEPIETKIKRIRRFRAQFDLDQEYVFGIFNKDETVLIGGTGFHNRVGKDAFEIGYWINVNYINQGYCTETVNALVKVGFEHYQLQRIEIHCDPENLASASIHHDATLRKRQYNEKGELRDAMIWSLFKNEYEQSALNTIHIEFYDALENKL